VTLTTTHGNDPPQCLAGTTEGLSPVSVSTTQRHSRPQAFIELHCLFSGGFGLADPGHHGARSAPKKPSDRETLVLAGAPGTSVLYPCIEWKSGSRDDCTVDRAGDVARGAVHEMNPRGIRRFKTLHCGMCSLHCGLWTWCRGLDKGGVLTPIGE
jgi:hypothetical protein